MNTKKPTKIQTKPRKKSKPYNREPSKLLRNTVKIYMEHGGSMSAAMRAAGYSVATAKNPQKIKESKTYIELMNEVGLGDDALVKLHQELATSVERKEEIYQYEEIKVGKKFKLVAPLDEDIKADIESTPSRVLVLIKDRPQQSIKIAVYIVPDTFTRSRALIEAYKVRGNYAPQKIQDVRDPLTPEEQEMLSGIFGKNKK